MQLRHIAFIGLISARSAAAFTLMGTDSDLKGWDDSNVVFHLNPTDCPSSVGTLFDDAIKVWNEVPNSKLRVSRGADTQTSIQDAINGVATDTPVIFCIPQISAFGVNPDSIPGFATGLRLSGDGHVDYGYLVLNVDPSGLANIQRFDQDLVKVIIAHEVGHVLGFGHSDNTSSLMYYDGTEKKELSLGQDDMDAITYLYPRDELGKDKPLGCAVIGGVYDSSRSLITIILLSFPLMFTFATNLIRRRIRS